MKKLTPIKSIRKFCLSCLGGSFQEVKECSAEETCSLYPYRLGRRPTTTIKSSPTKKR